MLRGGSVAVRTTPAPAGGVAADYIHEPAGLTVDYSHTGDTLAQGADWAHVNRAGGTATIVTDVTAPRGGTNVVQFNYTTSMAGGSEPALIQRSFPGASQPLELFMAYWIKYDPGYVGSLSGINKHVNAVLVGGSPAGARAWVVSRSYEDNNALGPYHIVCDYNRNNGAGCELNYHGTQPYGGDVATNHPVNTWHKVELHLRRHAGADTGLVRMWVNDVLITDSTSNACQGTAFESVEMCPVFGGTDVPTKSQWVRITELYVKGRTA